MPRREDGALDAPNTATATARRHWSVSASRKSGPGSLQAAGDSAVPLAFTIVLSLGLLIPRTTDTDSAYAICHSRKDRSVGVRRRRTAKEIGVPRGSAESNSPTTGSGPTENTLVRWYCVSRVNGREREKPQGTRARGADSGRGGRPRGQTLCLQAAQSVTWPCFDRELGPLRSATLLSHVASTARSCEMFR